MQYVCKVNKAQQNLRIMKAKQELSEKLIKRLESIKDSQDESHKIKRIEFSIQKIKELSTKSKSELKQLLQSDCDTTFSISFAFITELDMLKITKHDMFHSFELHKHLIGIN